MRIINFPNCEGFHLFCKITRFFATESLLLNGWKKSYDGDNIGGDDEKYGKIREKIFKELELLQGTS